MPSNNLEAILNAELSAIDESGTAKRKEPVITKITGPVGKSGPRFFLEGEGPRPFIRMNSNGYLGMALRAEVIAAEESAVRALGSGPGAVRFISGTFHVHTALEQRLAEFHKRPAAMIFNSAYAAVMGVLPCLVTPETAVISDELNHNCIINATRLGRPGGKYVYRHLDMEELERSLEAASQTCRRALVVTDGVFSMRGDHAPLPHILELANRYERKLEESCCVMVDDSHGVGAFGATGRGTEEFTGSGGVDIFVATLGKAFGANGGYMVGSRVMVDYLREKAPFYIYSNPITPGEAAAALKALDILDSPSGRTLLDKLRFLTERFRRGLQGLGYETLPGQHPVVPLMVRDTARTRELVLYLRGHGVLATGLNFPVVPRGSEEVRFQVSADHTEADIDEVLGILEHFPGRNVGPG